MQQVLLVVMVLLLKELPAKGYWVAALAGQQTVLAAQHLGYCWVMESLMEVVVRRMLTKNQMLSSRCCCHQCSLPAYLA
jgi:hypothetical protein